MSPKSIKHKTDGVPIVALLGHVDHGKTSILDRIRESDVQSREAGGITQKISVFTIKPNKTTEKYITFIDTPGHEAFDLMRQRGGNVADVVLLIVAADDGVMPQTAESIEIIKGGNAKPIVVINKCDLPDIDLPKIKRELANKGMQVEDMGGNIPCVEVSGKTGKGIPELLDMINLVIDVEGYAERAKLPEGVEGKAFVLESVKDKSKGFLSSVVVVQGIFDVGGWLAYKSGDQTLVEKIKGFVNEDNLPLSVLKTGFGGKMLGLSTLLELGAEIYLLPENDKKIVQNLFPKEEKSLVEQVEAGEVSAEDLLFSAFSVNEPDEGKKFKVIVKASSEGSLEAIKKSISNINIEGCKVEVIESGLGDISIKDVELAAVTKAILLGFEVSKEKGVEDLAAKRKVLIRSYDVIYKLIEEVNDVIEMMSSPEPVEEEIGNAEIRQIFTLSDGKKVLGCRVKNGIIKRGEKCYIVRGDDIISEGKLSSMKHQKTEVKESKNGDDFGAIMEPTPDVQEGDMIFCYKVMKN